MSYQQFAQQGQQYLPVPPPQAQPSLAQPVQPGAASAVCPKRKKKKQTQPQPQMLGQVIPQRSVQTMLPYNAPSQVPQSGVVVLGTPFAAPPVTALPPDAPPAAVPSATVLPPIAIGSSVGVPPVPEQAKAKRTGRCWKCVVDTHATKDCTA
jgi:hypothetical protein